jgi:hypothetical protein
MDTAGIWVSTLSTDIQIINNTITNCLESTGDQGYGIGFADVDAGNVFMLMKVQPR